MERVFKYSVYNFVMSYKKCISQTFLKVCTDKIQTFAKEHIYFASGSKLSDHLSSIQSI